MCTSRSAPSTSKSAGCARRSRPTDSTGSFRRCMERATGFRATRSSLRPRLRRRAGCGDQRASDCPNGPARHNGGGSRTGADPMTLSRIRTQELRRLAAGAFLQAIVDYLLGLTPWLLLAGACAYASWHVYHVHLLARWLAGGGREPEPDTRGIWAQVFESLSRIPEPNPSPEPQAQEAPAQGRDSIPAGGGGDAGRRDRPRRRRYDPVDEQGIEPAARPAARARRRPAGVELHSPSELHRLARYRRRSTSRFTSRRRCEKSSGSSSGSSPTEAADG